MEDSMLISWWGGEVLREARCIGGACDCVCFPRWFDESGMLLRLRVLLSVLSWSACLCKYCTVNTALTTHQVQIAMIYALGRLYGSCERCRDLPAGCLP